MAAKSRAFLASDSMNASRIQKNRAVARQIWLATEPLKALGALITRLNLIEDVKLLSSPHFNRQLVMHNVRN